MAEWEAAPWGIHFCSECGMEALYNVEGDEKLSLYCPYCGEKMDVEKREG